jgi:hypothetical protein
MLEWGAKTGEGTHPRRIARVELKIATIRTKNTNKNCANVPRAAIAGV